MIHVIYSYELDPEHSTIIEDVDAFFESLEDLENDLVTQRNDPLFCGYEIVNS